MLLICLNVSMSHSFPQQTLYEQWYLIALLNCCAEGISMRGNSRISATFANYYFFLVNTLVTQYRKSELVIIVPKVCALGCRSAVIGVPRGLEYSVSVTVHSWSPEGTV